MKRIEAEDLKVFQTELKMEDGQSFHLRYGPLDLYIEKIHGEVRVWWMTSNDWMDSSFHYEFPFTGMMPTNLLTARRYAWSQSEPKLKVHPCLGEKPFVIKPDTTFMILPGETSKIYLSTPMNIRLINAITDEEIDEIPVLHRIKTWFGDSPTSGQLCYFTRIHAALLEANLPFRPHRALTQLYIQNSSKDPIPIEKLKIPVNYLDLFQDVRGLFVTSSLSLRISSSGMLKDLKIFPPTTEEGYDVTRIHQPRSPLPKNLFKSIAEIMR